MKKKIEIEFDGEDKNGFTEYQIDSLNTLLMNTILEMFKWSTPKKVTIDGNVFWLRTENDAKAPIAKKYPLHHEELILLNRPKL